MERELDIREGKRIRKRRQVFGKGTRIRIETCNRKGNTHSSKEAGFRERDTYSRREHILEKGGM